MAISFYEYSFVLFLKGDFTQSFSVLRTFKAFKFLPNSSSSEKEKEEEEDIDQQTLYYSSTLLEAKLRMQLGLPEVPALLMKCLRLCPDRQKLLHFIMARFLLTQNSKCAWKYFESGKLSCSNNTAQELEEFTILEIYSLLAREESYLE